MKRRQAIALCLASALVLAAAVAVEWYPLPDASAQLAAIPREGPGYTAQEVPLTDMEAEQLGKARAVKLLVMNTGGAPFLFSAVDGTRNRHAVHDPDYCFRGAGWRIVDETLIDLPGGPVKHVTLERDHVNREAIYWYGDGDERFTAPEKYWWRATLRRVTLGVSGEEPVLYVIQGLMPGSLPISTTDNTVPEVLAPWLN